MGTFLSTNTQFNSSTATRMARAESATQLGSNYAARRNFGIPSPISLIEFVSLAHKHTLTYIRNDSDILRPKGYRE